MHPVLSQQCEASTLANGGYESTGQGRIGPCGNKVAWDLSAGVQQKRPSPSNWGLGGRRWDQHLAEIKAINREDSRRR